MALIFNLKKNIINKLAKNEWSGGIRLCVASVVVVVVRILKFKRVLCSLFFLEETQKKRIYCCYYLNVGNHQKVIEKKEMKRNSIISVGEMA